MGKTHQIVLASNNPGKLREISEMVAGLQIELLPQSQFDVSEVEETGMSFIENALIKARHAAAFTGLPAIADDSGIELDALAGAPGIYSARYAGKDASDEENLIKLIEDVKQIPEKKRTARFVCCMVYLRHADDPEPVVAEGRWEGIAITDPKGKKRVWL